MLSTGKVALCSLSRRLSRPFVRRARRRRHRALPRAVRRSSRRRTVAARLPAQRCVTATHRKPSRDAREALRARDDIAALVIEPIQGRAGCHRTAGRLSRGDARRLRRAAHRDDRRRDLHRLRAHRDLVRDRSRRRRSRHSLYRQGDGLRHSDQRRNRPVAASWMRGRRPAGEALHTSTYLGNPLGCAAALATIDEIERLQLPARAAELGARLRPRLDALALACRRCRRPWLRVAVGRGFHDAAAAFAVVKGALKRGVIVSQSGVDGDIVAITPPLIIDERCNSIARSRFSSSPSEETANRRETLSHRNRRRRLRRNGHLPALTQSSALRSRRDCLAVERRRDRAPSRNFPYAFRSCAEMLAGCELDAVTVASPPFAHRAGRSRCARGPQARALREAVRARRRRCARDARAAKTAGTACGVSHEFRFVPEVAARQGARRQQSPRSASQHRDHLAALDPAAEGARSVARMVVRTRARRRSCRRRALAPRRSG